MRRATALSASGIFSYKLRSSSPTPLRRMLCCVSGSCLKIALPSRIFSARMARFSLLPPRMFFTFCFPTVNVSAIAPIGSFLNVRLIASSLPGIGLRIPLTFSTAFSATPCPVLNTFCAVRPVLRSPAPATGIAAPATPPIAAPPTPPMRNACNVSKALLSSDNARPASYAAPVAAPNFTPSFTPSFTMVFNPAPARLFVAPPPAIVLPICNPVPIVSFIVSTGFTSPKNGTLRTARASCPASLTNRPACSS